MRLYTNVILSNINIKLTNNQANLEFIIPEKFNNDLMRDLIIYFWKGTAIKRDSGIQ